MKSKYFKAKRVDRDLFATFATARSYEIRLTEDIIYKTELEKKYGRDVYEKVIKFAIYQPFIKDERPVVFHWGDVDDVCYISITHETYAAVAAVLASENYEEFKTKAISLVVVPRLRPTEEQYIHIKELFKTFIDIYENFKTFKTVKKFEKMERLYNELNPKPTGRPGKRPSDEELELRFLDYTTKQIAEMYDVNVSTVRGWRRYLRLKK